MAISSWWICIVVLLFACKKQITLLNLCYSSTTPILLQFLFVCYMHMCRLNKYLYSQ
jgi:hypothetical protein